ARRCHQAFPRVLSLALRNARPIGPWRARPTASARASRPGVARRAGWQRDKTRSLHRPCRKARGLPAADASCRAAFASSDRRAYSPLHVALGAASSPALEGPIPMTRSPHGPLRVGIGGPVGSGKTALMEALCKSFRDRYEICAITNDIYTKEDALILTRAGALPEERIMGVETGGCPHTAIREDASINLAAIVEMKDKFPKLDLILIESGGDNLAATFSPELADLTIYVIDVAQGEKIHRQGGPGNNRSHLLELNRTGIATYVGA